MELVQQDASNAGTDVRGEIDASLATVWERVDNMIDGLLASLPNLTIAAVVFSAFLVLAAFVRRFVRDRTKDHRKENLGIVVGRLLQAALVLTGAVIGISIVDPGVGFTELFGLLGVSGVAIGFAFRDILQNFLAGLLILIREPFHIGDSVEAGGFSGTVEAIETRATVLKTYDGRRVLIPNSEIYTEVVTVNNAHPARRTEVTVGVGYDEDLDEVRERIVAACAAVEGVHEDPAPQALVWELGGSTVDLKVRWWTDTDKTTPVRDRVVGAVKDALDAAGIEMPFPTRVLHVERGPEAAPSSVERELAAADSGR